MDLFPFFRKVTGVRGVVGFGDLAEKSAMWDFELSKDKKI